MSFIQYQVDAFAERVFEGNPAAVVPMQAWPDDVLLQSIAMENNLAATAYFVPSGEGYELRWFTPTVELDLCGHATLASAHVLYTELGCSADILRFFTRSGELQVRRLGVDQYVMDFPAVPTLSCPEPPGLARALGCEPSEVLVGEGYWLAVYAGETEIRSLQTNFALLSELDAYGIIVTAPGKQHDFVSRFFAPNMGVAEDPVTGSAHCRLATYWARRLGKTTLSARQVSPRGGDVGVELVGTRVRLAGRAALFMVGELRAVAQPQ